MVQPRQACRRSISGRTPPIPLPSSALEAAVARRLCVIPVRYEGDRLLVAMVEPGPTSALDEVAALTGIPVAPAIATKAAIMKAIETAYGAGERKRASKSDSRWAGRQVQADARPSRGARARARRPTLPTSTSQTVYRPCSGSTATSFRSRVTRRWIPRTSQRVVYGMLSQKQREKLRGGPRARFLVLAPGQSPLPRERLQQRGATRRRLQARPLRHQDGRRSRHCPTLSRSSPVFPAVSSSSPGRPARESRRRSQRWST